EIVLDLPTAFDPGLRPAAEPQPVAPEPPAPQPFPAADAPFSAGDRIGAGTVPAALRGLSAPPIHAHQFRRESRWPALLWGLGLIVALALLPAQYLYFNFNNLARGELRPWLAQ